MITSRVQYPRPLCSTAFSNGTCTPVKVSDRIAFFEEKALASTFQNLSKTGEGTTVGNFLTSIGQEAPQSFGPNLWRWAFDWKNRVQTRVHDRKTDAGFYSLSKELDHLDAILYSDSALLEIEALNLVSCANREIFNDVYDDEEDDDEDEKEEEKMEEVEDYDSTEELPALESGALELAKELENFARLCCDNQDPSQNTLTNNET